MTYQNEFGNFISQHEYIEALLDYCPNEFRSAVYAVHGKIGSPLSLIVTSMLSTLSSAAQSHIDVYTIYGAVQPISLFTLVVADSGERKTSTDRLVSAPLIEYDNMNYKRQQELKGEAQSKLTLWKIQVKCMEAQLARQVAKNELNDIELTRQCLAQYYLEKPVEVTAGRTLLNDVTAPALLKSLSGEGQARTLASSDAGNLFSRANTDFISAVNQIWDGENINVIRKAEEFDVINGRLTISAMIQGAVLTRISNRKEDLLRTSGLLARVLFTVPESTQGQRFYSENGTVNFEALNLYHEKLKELLKVADKYRESKKKRVLDFTPSALQELRNYYDWVEENLQEYSKFSDVRDAGSKIVNNATRIAALLHLCSGNADSEHIDGDTALAACQLAEFYLLEFRRAFGEKTLEEREEENGELLYDWLVKEGYNRIGAITNLSLIRQLGPNKLRKKEELFLALNYLDRHGVIACYTDCRPAYIEFIEWYTPTRNEARDPRQAEDFSNRLSRRGQRTHYIRN